MRNTFVLCLLSLFVFIASAADITGKWTADVPGREGQMNKTTFDLKEDGGKVTGTVTNPRGDMAISDGKVEGDTVSFITKANFGGNDIKIMYTGKVAGGEIKFTREVEGRGKTEFVAKKAAS